jgi:hypothetical protein
LPGFPQDTTALLKISLLCHMALEGTDRILDSPVRCWVVVKRLYLMRAFFILADLRNPQVGLSTVFLSALFFFLRDNILKIRGTGKLFMPSTEYIATIDFEAFRAFGT